MKKCVFSLIIGTILSTAVAQVSEDKNRILSHIDEHSQTYGEISRQIWEFAEVGYQEEKSSLLLQTQLSSEGFDIESGVAGIPTAFVASFGNGKPIIAILGEFDALPGLSKEESAEQKTLIPGGAGHGCGHNLFGAGSASAVVAVKDWLNSSGQKGTIRFYGTPAEEGGAGKVYMAREGLFDDVDVVLHWHPGNVNNASAHSSLANKSAKFRFYGKASHASVAPEQGRSALDGVESMNYMVNMLREHMHSDSRIHYVITSGGEAPNVVPAFAEAYYYVRNPEAKNVKELFDRVVKASEGAAMGTGTRVEHEVIHGVYNVLPNETLSKIMYENLNMVGGFNYTDEEMIFAEQLQKTFDNKLPLEDASKVKSFEIVEGGMGGSTDVGDISWLAPTAGVSTATFIPGSPIHSWQSTAAAGSSIGRKGMTIAAKTLALTAYDIFNNPAIIEKATSELNKRRGIDYQYEALIGDRKPPLDYRNNN